MTCGTASGKNGGGCAEYAGQPNVNPNTPFDDVRAVNHSERHNQENKGLHPGVKGKGFNIYIHHHVKFNDNGGAEQGEKHAAHAF